MNIKNLINQIRGQVSSQPELTDEVMIKFLRVLERVREDDLSCEDTYAKLDEFVETEVKGGDADKIAPLIREHLDMCSDCCDEYEALLAVIEHTHKEN
jgi:hypothetical protein